MHYKLICVQDYTKKFATNVYRILVSGYELDEKDDLIANFQVSVQMTLCFIYRIGFFAQLVIFCVGFKTLDTNFILFVFCHSY